MFLKEKYKTDESFEKFKVQLVKKQLKHLVHSGEYDISHGGFGC